jgi:hypothetical protein
VEGGEDVNKTNEEQKEERKTVYKQRVRGKRMLKSIEEEEKKKRV